MKKWLLFKKCQKKWDAVKFSMVIPYRTNRTLALWGLGGSEETFGVPATAFIIRIIECSRIGVQVFGNDHIVA